ncbi:hypothetical protein F183_A44030 [Bryobacterales bacterium F-183]|nr:hypothetical protein F183_A44030 [Bryobacterales bacterium F-183]
MDITREHPDYVARKRLWRSYRDLYAGGEQIRANATEYLEQRQREPGAVYRERISKVFYENYIGSIVDWYAATLFRREPLLTFEGPNEAGKRYFSNFIEDCDRLGTNLTDFLRSRLIEALVGGASYILVDFPKGKGIIGSRAAEDASGRSRAYLVGYAAEDVINWSYDDQGQLDWVVLRTSGLRKTNVEDDEWKNVTTWSYYDKRRYRIYRQIGGDADSRTARIELLDEGLHGLAKQDRVPLFGLEIQEGLWLLNKAASLQIEHFGKSNALAWGLSMGLFAMPVVYSERQFDQTFGEAYYLQLGPGDRFGWTEPDGKVYQIAAENLERLKDEIYRVCYLAQMGGKLSAGQTQSAQSKMWDFSITQEVLRAYGDSIKDLVKKVLRAIETAREDGLQIGVSGLDEFDIGDFTTELSDAERLLGLGIESPTLKQQIFKKLALKYLCDVRQEVKDRIADEIDASFPRG